MGFCIQGAGVGDLEPVPCGLWGTIVVKFMGSQELYLDFRLWGRLVLLTPALFKGTLCLKIKMFKNT